MFWKRRRKTKQSKPVEMDLTPMIDVTFQLLIFFMLSMNFKQMDAKLRTWLPKKDGLQPTPVKTIPVPDVRIHLKAIDPRTSLVQFEQNRLGKVTFLGESGDTEAPANARIWDSLIRKVASIEKSVFEANQEHVKMIIEAGDEVPLQFVVNTIDACKSANIETIKFAGNPDHEPSLNQ